MHSWYTYKSILFWEYFSIKAFCLPRFKFVFPDFFLVILPREAANNSLPELTVKMETYSDNITHNNGLLKWKLILTISFVIALFLALAFLFLTNFSFVKRNITLSCSLSDKHFSFQIIYHFIPFQFLLYSKWFQTRS